MAHRVITSDSEDDDVIGKSKVIRNKRIVDSYNEEEDSVDNPDINSFSSSTSSDVYSEPESISNESFSPLQVTHKRMAKQRVILTDDEEEDPSYSPPKDDRKPAINTRMAKQRVVLTDDEEEDQRFSPSKDDREPAINKVDNKDASMTGNAKMNAQLGSREVVGGEVNTHEEGTGEERTESSGESNKENTSPPSNSSLPEKPATVPVLGVSQAKPLVTCTTLAKEVPQAVVRSQQQVPTYHVAYTRPALLKQLEYVKVRIIVIVFN